MNQTNGINKPNGINGINSTHPFYSVPAEAEQLFHKGLLENPLISKDLPKEAEECSRKVKFTGSDEPSIPINWRFAESAASLKGLEATMINVLLKRKYGLDPQEVIVDTDMAQLFFMSTLLWTIDPDREAIPAALGLGGDKKKGYGLDKYFPSCDIHRMNSTFHRASATNIYKTADDRYFHLHGSLNPDPSLASVGLPPDLDAPTIEDSWKPFITSMSKIQSNEMQRLASDTYHQAGTICYNTEEFKNSEHGKANSHIGLFEIIPHHNPTQPPTWWPSSPQTSAARPLAGLKVVDLTRIIAAPAVTRGLAELGASIMRVTAPHITDYGVLHVDLNWGKWNCHLDLRDESDRSKLRALVLDADVVVQGYRSGILDKYGFGQQDIINLCSSRARGIISVRENCYGWHGPWSYRSGWQQISDANTGVSASFGAAMGLEGGEAVTPVFPNSDYMTGVSGVIGILATILQRAEIGGSYAVDLALNYYSQWLVNSVGTYPENVWQDVWTRNGRQGFRCFHAMGYTIPRYLSMIKENSAQKLLKPEFFEERAAEGVLGKGKKIRAVKPILQFPDGKVRLGYNVGTRGNGIDAARWPDDLMTEIVT